MQHYKLINCESYSLVINRIIMLNLLSAYGSPYTVKVQGLLHLHAMIVQYNTSNYIWTVAARFNDLTGNKPQSMMPYIQDVAIIVVRNQ